jgi:hypothetical protein
MAVYTTIDDPSAHFQTTLFTGGGATVVTVTNDGNSDLSPDLLWFKRRDSATAHVLMDTTQGANVTSGNGPSGYNITSNINTAASQIADNTGVMTITSNGFTSKEMTYTAGNVSTGSMCCWQWKMNGGTSASNTDGNITSTVQANTTAGQSIVTWTGTENNSATVGHGLDKAPETIIYKRGNNASYGWTAHLLQLGTLSNGNTYTGYPHVTNSWEQTTMPAPTATIIKPTSGATTNSGTMFAYCFHSVQGYSKMGKYKGNGNSNGPFIYTGFKPAFIYLKGNQTNNWVIYDHKRPGFNNKNYEFYGNETTAEYQGASYHNIDILSNGFKCKLTDASINQNGSIYAYMAFAENPFVTSTGVPTTAR